MNKKVLKGFFVVAIAVVASINVFNAQNPEVLSDVAMANVEALASIELNIEDCDYSLGDECKVVIVTPNGSHINTYIDQRNKIDYL